MFALASHVASQASASAADTGVAGLAAQASASAAETGDDFQDAIADEAIVVFVRDLFNVSHVVEASMGTTGLGIMQMLYPIVELLPWQYVLIFGGRALGLDETLGVAGVMDGNTLFMKGKLAGGGKRAHSTDKESDKQQVRKFRLADKMLKVEPYANKPPLMAAHAMLKMLETQLNNANSVPFTDYVKTKATLAELEAIKDIMEVATSQGGTEGKVHKMASIMIAHYAEVDALQEGAKLMTEALKATLYQLYLKEFAVAERCKNKGFLVMVEQEIAVLRATGGVHQPASSAAAASDATMG